MKNYVFIDIFTQKGFVENFGSKAIEDCPDIRENLMDVTSLAIKNGIKVISLMWTGLSDVPVEIGVGSDFEKVADTEMESSGFEDLNGVGAENGVGGGDGKGGGGEFQQRLVKVNQLDLIDLELVVGQEEVLFVYGVPLESSVMEFCRKYVSKCAKLWIVQDAVKSTNGNEEAILAELKVLGAKMITSRNLEKFINI